MRHDFGDAPWGLEAIVSLAYSSCAQWNRLDCHLVVTSCMELMLNIKEQKCFGFIYLFSYGLYYFFCIPVTFV